MLPHGVASEVKIFIILVICYLDYIAFNLELWRQFLGGPKRKVTRREEYPAP